MVQILGTRRRSVRCRGVALCWLAVLAAGSSPAQAAGPEQLEQLEPGGGEWQFEYHSLIGRGSEDEHSLQTLKGVSDHLAIGVEVEAEWSAGTLKFDGFAPTVLYRFSDGSNRIGIGVAAQVEFAGDLSIASTEARLILEKRSRRWWGQGNLIVNRLSEDGESGIGLAYGWGLSRSIAADVWVGAEGSGQAARLAGSASAIPEGGHFFGPALTIEHELDSGSEFEIGIAYLHRIAGEGPLDAARLFVQFNL